jgi:hypothetical protein
VQAAFAALLRSAISLRVACLALTFLQDMERIVCWLPLLNYVWNVLNFGNIGGQVLIFKFKQLCEAVQV